MKYECWTSPLLENLYSPLQQSQLVCTLSTSHELWLRLLLPYGNFTVLHFASLCFPQVLEDTTGVRRVVVTPQSPECYPPSYSPALSPTHHLPPYLTHPHFIPNSFYPPVSPGELPPHQYYQHHLPPMYGDPGTVMSTALFPSAKSSGVLYSFIKIQLGIKLHIFLVWPKQSSLSTSAEIIPVYGMSNYIGREETYSKPQPKKIKEQRQLERQNRLNSPPSNLYKGSLGLAHNGYRWA